MSKGYRRVTAAHDTDGRAHIAHDGPPPLAVDVDAGPSVAELLWLDGPVRSVDDPADRTSPADGFPLEPPPGGVSLRIIRLPAPDPGAPADRTWLRVPGDHDDQPGMHATDTLDVMVVLEGQVVLGLDHGEHLLGSGDAVVQRGTAHRWRVVGDQPMSYAVLMLRPDPAGPPPGVPLVIGSVTGRAGSRLPRRAVTGVTDGGRSVLVSDGGPPQAAQPGGADSVALIDLWQTGGSLGTCGQGGDADGGFVLEPLGGGVSARIVELPAGHDPGEAGWHATDTIDVNLVLSGRLELSLPDTEPVVIEPGQAVLQRGTNHRWRPVGDTPARWFAVMFALS